MDRSDSELEDQLSALQDTPTTTGPKHAWPSSSSSRPGSAAAVKDRKSLVYTPPPHITARIYRSANNRRRSSAASSRRNSLSSTHSHQSNSKVLRTFHSNSVAQQLRRASILENRKARLADRAAHVEQVRMRAAQIQATPRVSNSEERTIAAQQAREKYLARVAAACAEEVNRAKRVAEEMKERKAAEERQARQDLEEKHAEAERRRIEYKRTTAIRKPRASSTTILESPRKLTESKRAALSIDAATARIQRAWRRFQKRKAVRDFQSLHLSIEHVQKATFKDATTLLEEVQVNERTRNVIVMLSLIRGADSPEASSLEARSAVRKFLSAFMILGHPNDVFSRDGQQEQDLIAKAKDLLIFFEDVLSQIRSTDGATASATDLEKLSQAYAAYMSAFAAWTTRDARVLLGLMVDQFVILDEIWQSVKDYRRGEVAEDYREGIRDNQILLLSRIKKLAGPERAHLLIKKAIRESRMAKPRRRPVGDVRPRPLDASDQDGASNTTSLALSAENAGVSMGEEDPLQRQNDNLDSNSDVFGSASLSRVFSIIPPNRRLVHELLIDPAFKIESSPNSDIHNALNREICERMRQGMQQGQGEIWTIAVAENIRSRLLKLLKPGNSMHELLSEVLDTDHVRTQYQHGTFSYENFFNFMADLLPRLCAPFRDNEVKALADVLKTSETSMDSSIEKLFGLLRMIDLMSLDYTNYLLHQSAPTLIGEGLGYEMRMFAQDLESGSTSLDRLKKWWKNASVNAHTESTSAPDQQNTLDRRHPNFTRVYARGLIDLAIGTNKLQDFDVPETLAADTDRLRKIRIETLRFVTIGGILLTAKNLLKRDIRSQWKPEAKRILEALKANNQSLEISEDTSFQQSPIDHAGQNSEIAARIMAIIESSHGMPASSREQLNNIVVRFLRDTCIVGLEQSLYPADMSIQALSSTPSESPTSQPRLPRITDPVLALLHRRLKLHLLSRLSASNSTDRVRMASTASEGLASIGLGEFVPLINGISETLERIRKADLGSHDLWIKRVAKELDSVAEDHEDEAPGSAVSGLTGNDAAGGASSSIFDQPRNKPGSSE